MYKGYRIKRLHIIFGIYKDNVLMDYCASYDAAKMIIDRYKDVK